MELQIEIRMLHALPQNLVFLKKTPLLMLTSQNKALFIILTNPNKVLCIKIKQSSENSWKTALETGSISSVIISQ